MGVTTVASRVELAETTDSTRSRSALVKVSPIRAYWAVLAALVKARAAKTAAPKSQPKGTKARATRQTSIATKVAARVCSRPKRSAAQPPIRLPGTPPRRIQPAKAAAAAGAPAQPRWTMVGSIETRPARMAKIAPPIRIRAGARPSRRKGSRWVPGAGRPWESGTQSQKATAATRPITELRPATRRQEKKSSRLPA